MAGGLGTRMRSHVPKHLHPLLGRRVVDWVIAAARELGADPLVVVASPSTRDAYEDDGLRIAVQEEARGTGDAVASARAELEGFGGRVLILDAAAPLLTAEILGALVGEHERERAAVTLLSIEPETPLPYGRVIRDDSGAVRAIVEDGDATSEQRAVRELNSSLYVFEAAALWDAVGRLEPHNVQGELYLTDAVAHVVAAGGKAAAYRCPDVASALGINNRAELAFAASVLRARIDEAHMLAGVTIVDPSSTWIDADVEVEADATIHPFTVLRGRTRVRGGAEVGPHVVAVDAEVGTGVTVGPFCYLRPGTVLEAGAKAGTFVEIKNSNIGSGAKVPHLSYIGDAEIGERANIAAGNITANFSHRPGVPKGRTVIGRDVRTGVDNTFKAPVTIGDEAWIFPGTVITEDVPPGALAGFPPRQVNKEDYVRRNRDD
jgi:bifunctional UDP-N-acetylglucosamine pyrophosphorylase/glucosamine-1-phosphate N-acetyltransferase